MTLCEENFDFNKYDKNTKKVLCQCPIKTTIFKISEINIDKKELYNKFTDVKNLVNLTLMKCYKVLFTKSGIISNVGSYIVILIILFYFLSIIIFYKKDLYHFYYYLQFFCHLFFFHHFILSYLFLFFLFHHEKKVKK